ncbi:aldehyde dehydrogenase [Mycolicibacterium holsaticum]|uniref:Aldehyde dehydrogenase n=1 Tax=Mycolicibacterium holsaticum TaxID=152142 RepID=A0A1E3RW61_9MYCO|nr:aldehyde dehydrogenase [Mycolicibacterium holsaticum]ODQ94090.1 aldehyde dehydrogenase [Mycolicibacterium holsaticum]
MDLRGELLIDGVWRTPVSAVRIPVVSPSTGEVIGQAPDADAEDVDRAVQAARRSLHLGEWRNASVDERAAVLDRALDLLMPRSAEIAALVTSEMGLPITYAGVQIPGALGVGRYFLDTAQRIPATEVLRTSCGPAAVLREPVGVVASIAPWNGPFNMAVAKIWPALVAGCSMVFKPAPETPLDGYLLAEALVDAGLPRGVFNYVTGDADAGRALVAHPDVDKVSFTGSTAVGREIGRHCATRFARVQLELGGKSAAIVLDDADLETTMTGLATGSFFNTGQVCASYSRVLVPRGRYDEIVGALVATAESFVVGDPFDPQTTMGPLVSTRQRERVLGYLEIGRSEGATLATGGQIPDGFERGAFIQPAVFVGVHGGMRIAQEEIFGPVACVLCYDTVDEAVAIANDSDYGLHGAVFTTDPGRAAEVAHRVRTGTFSVNSFTYNPEAPFGGVKSSGIGRDTGPQAVESYYELKTVNLTEDTIAPFL